MFSTCATYAPNYFSLDDLLATQERVPLTAVGDVRGLGFLDPSSCVAGTASSSSVLAAGSKVEVPLWMASALAKSSRTASVQVGMPEIFEAKNKSRLQADPRVLQLPRLGPHHFYETGRHLLKVCASAEEVEALGELLVELLRGRFKMIYDDATNLDQHDVSSTPDSAGSVSAVSATASTAATFEKLDLLERTLHATGKESSRSVQRWIDRKTEQISTAGVVARHLAKKRKAWVL